MERTKGPWTLYRDDSELSVMKLQKSMRLLPTRRVEGLSIEELPKDLMKEEKEDSHDKAKRI